MRDALCLCLAVPYVELTLPSTPKSVPFLEIGWNFVGSLFNSHPSLAFDVDIQEIAQKPHLVCQHMARGTDHECQVRTSQTHSCGSSSKTSFAFLDYPALCFPLVAPSLVLERIIWGFACLHPISQIYPNSSDQLPGNRFAWGNHRNVGKMSGAISVRREFSWRAVSFRCTMTR